MPTSQMLSNDSDVHQGLDGPSYDVTSTVEETESSDTMPLSTLMRKIKAKRVQCTSERGRAKGKEKSPPAGAKREKLGSAKTWGKTAVRSLKNRRRRTRTPPAPASLGNEENTSRICEFFSENTETTSGAGKKRTRESSLTSDVDVAIEALLFMSHGQLPPSVGSSVPQDNQIEDEIPVCVINKNPSEFETQRAKKFMYRC